MSATKLREKVNSIADLRLLVNIPVGKVIETDSYYGDGNGGGNTFTKVVTGTQVDNAGTIIVGADGGVYEALEKSKATLEQFGVTDTIVDEIETISNLGLTILLKKDTEYEITQENVCDNINIIGDNSTLSSIVLVDRDDSYRLMSSSGDVKFTGKITFDGKWDNSALASFTGTLGDKLLYFFSASSFYAEDIIVQNANSYGIDVGANTYIDNIRVIDNGYTGLRYNAKTGDSFYVNKFYGKTTTTDANARNVALTVNGKFYVENITINSFTGDNAVILTEADGSTSDSTPYYKNIQIGSYVASNTKLSTGLPICGKFNSAGNINIGICSTNQAVSGASIYFTEVKGLSIGTLISNSKTVINSPSTSIGVFKYTQGASLLNGEAMIEANNNKISVNSIEYTLTTDYTGVSTTGIFQLNDGATDTKTDITIGSIFNSSLLGEKISVFRASSSRRAIVKTQDSEYISMASTFFPSVSQNRNQFTLYDSSSASGYSFLGGDEIFFYSPIETYSSWLCLKSGSTITGSWIKIKNFTGFVDIDYQQVAKTSVPTLQTGSSLNLSNPSGYPYNMSSASAATTYTTTNHVVNGNATSLINTTSQPTVTGGTLVPGSTWVTGTNMKMTVYYDGVRVEYFFLSLT